jgi:hypothetical protein
MILNTAMADPEGSKHNKHVEWIHICFTGGYIRGKISNCSFGGK